MDLFVGKGLQTTVDHWKAGQPKPPPSGGEPEPDPNSPIAEHTRVLGRITHDVVEYQAHDRVDSGLVDPYFTALARNMRENWKPGPKMVGGSEGKGAGGDLENFARSWHAAAKQYGATGSPLAADAAPGPAPTHEFQRDPVGGGFDSADFAARVNNGDMGFLSGLVVLQLTQNAKGEATDIRVLQSSGSAALDESARAEVKRVAHESPPPAHGLGLGGPTIRTVWKMEARMVTNGIMPSATFDPSLGSSGIQAPMQTHMVTRIELVAIYGGETGSHPVAPE